MIVDIDVLFNRKRTHAEVNKDFLWYDPVDKVMHKLSGGYLKYDYVPFEMNGERMEVLTDTMGWVDGKTIAIADSLKIVQYQDGDNEKEITSWFNENEDELQLEWLNNDSKIITISFPDDKEDSSFWKDAVEDSLYERRFRYGFRNA